MLCRASSPQSVTVSIQDHTNGNAVLASATLSIAGNGLWAQYNFNMTTTAGTVCTQIPAGSDPSIACGRLPNADHVCVRCGGQFAVTVGAGADVNVGYAFLQVRAWLYCGYLADTNHVPCRCVTLWLWRK